MEAQVVVANPPLEVHKRTPKGGTRNDHQTRRSIRPEILGETDGSSVGNAELKIASINERAMQC